uniref:Uncharacterized protein n=1 Tax=Oryza barthii TaxID=65489 RepID=A0A0D3HF21_9ORYZ
MVILQHVDVKAAHGLKNLNREGVMAIIFSKLTKLLLRGSLFLIFSILLLTLNQVYFCIARSKESCIRRMQWSPLTLLLSELFADIKEEPAAAETETETETSSATSEINQ